MDIEEIERVCLCVCVSWLDPGQVKYKGSTAVQTV
jgi:hypothetical protein